MATSDGGPINAAEFTGFIAYKSDLHKIITLSVAGVGYVGSGASFHTGHLWAIPEGSRSDSARR